MARVQTRNARAFVYVQFECPETLAAEMGEHLAWARARGARGLTRSTLARDALRAMLDDLRVARAAVDAAPPGPARDALLLRALLVAPYLPAPAAAAVPSTPAPRPRRNR